MDYVELTLNLALPLDAWMHEDSSAIHVLAASQSELTVKVVIFILDKGKIKSSSPLFRLEALPFLFHVCPKTVLL